MSALRLAIPLTLLLASACIPHAVSFEGAGSVSDAAYANLNTFLRNGGLILFDTKDSDLGQTIGGTTPNARALQRIALRLDVPALEVLPEDHVLTRTFYLLQEFPGRWTGEPVWVEAAPDTEAVEGMPFRNLNDGVTPVVAMLNTAGAIQVRVSQVFDPVLLSDWAAAFTVGTGFSTAKLLSLPLSAGGATLHVGTDGAGYLSVASGFALVDTVSGSSVTLEAVPLYDENEDVTAIRVDWGDGSSESTFAGSSLTWSSGVATLEAMVSVTLSSSFSS